MVSCRLTSIKTEQANIKTGITIIGFSCKICNWIQILTFPKLEDVWIWSFILSPSPSITNKKVLHTMCQFVQMDERSFGFLISAPPTPAILHLFWIMKEHNLIRSLVCSSSFICFHNYFRLLY